MNIQPELDAPLFPRTLIQGRTARLIVVENGSPIQPAITKIIEDPEGSPDLSAFIRLGYNKEPLSPSGKDQSILVTVAKSRKSDGDMQVILQGYGAVFGDRDAASFFISPKNLLNFLYGTYKFAAGIPAQRIEPYQEGQNWSDWNVETLRHLVPQHRVPAIHHYQLKDRALCETDPTFRQVLPYISVVDGKGNVLVYSRAKSGGEARLHAARSLGFGGHIDQVPHEGDLASDYLTEHAVRELMEELTFDNDALMESGVNIEENLTAQIHRALSDPADLRALVHTEGVGEVHAGIHMTVVIEEHWIQLNQDNDEIEGAQWLPKIKVAQIARGATWSLEPWSQEVAEAWEKEEKAEDLVLTA